MIMARSVRLETFQEDTAMHRAHIQRLQDSLCSARQDESDALRDLRNLEDARDTLLAHIAEIESIQIQIEQGVEL